ncbi:MAG: GNAT family N-acetyltransferase [Planctomycetaceae bacterium]|nr:GNAT family N-acetyltransferase [Planctomycetaceae bacterium]
MDLAVDRLLPSELDAGLRLSTQAGWNQTAADWQRALDLAPGSIFAGRVDGRLVATGAVSAIGSTIRWIGLILVDEAMRGRGYGSVMLDHCLRAARKAGTEIVGLDASDLGRPIYLKKGFVDVAPIDRWSGVLHVGGDPPDARELGMGSFDQIADLDRQACRTDRGPLLRSLLNQRDAVCLGCYRGQGLDGFAFLLPGRTAAHLGPAVAKHDTAMEALLGAAARKLGAAPVLLDVLRDEARSRLLERAGLTIARRLTRMTLDRGHEVLMGPMVRAAVSFTWG